MSTFFLKSLSFSIDLPTVKSLPVVINEPMDYAIEIYLLSPNNKLVTHFLLKTLFKGILDNPS